MKLSKKAKTSDILSKFQDNIDIFVTSDRNQFINSSNLKPKEPSIIANEVISSFRTTKQIYETERQKTKISALKLIKNIPKLVLNQYKPMFFFN